MKRFFVAALTGQSGSGKSFASEYLGKKGVPSVDGDLVARDIVEPGSPCLLELVKAFSQDILAPDGSLDRRRLGNIAFADPEKKALLDSITHPAIIEEMLKRFAELKEQGYRYCLVEAAALIESGLYSNCDRIILITATREAKLTRIMRRDNLTREQAETRLDAQADDDLIRSLADYVIENNGDGDDFIKHLDQLKDQLDRWFGSEKRKDQAYR